VKEAVYETERIKDVETKSNLEYFLRKNLISLIVCDIKDKRDQSCTGGEMDILLERKSVRNYTDEDVEKRDLDYILHAAMSAPTARNTRCYSFMVIKNKETHRKIAALHHAAQMILQAPLAILVVGDENIAFERYLPQDCSAATQNILLAATARGYGAVWCGVYSNEKISKAIEKLFNLPENIRAFSLVVIGKPVDNNPPKDRWQPEKIKYEIWK